MAISGINGYNLYGYQNAMNMLKLSFVQNTQRQAVSPVKRPSSVSSSSSVYGDIQSFLKSYQSELTGLEAAASRLTGASSRNVFNDYKAASTDEQVAVAKGSYRLRGNTDISLNVGALAQAQKNISSSHYSQETVDEGADMDFKITSGSGEALVSISSMNENGTAKTYNQMYQEAAKAINAQSSLGVKASVSNAEGKVSLILTSKSTGEANGFSVTGNVGAAAGLENASVQAQDAEYTVTENGYSQTYHSSSNTISLDYGRIDAALKGTGDTRVYTGGDEDEVVSAVEDLVKGYNSVTKLLEENAGRGTGAAAHLSSFKRGMADEKTLKALGITYDKDGYLQLDKDALKEALESDFEGTQSLIGGQFGSADRAAARAGSALSDSVQRIVNQDLASAITQNQNDNYAGYTQFGNFVRSGAYNLSNYYTVGLLFNMMA